MPTYDEVLMGEVSTWLSFHLENKKIKKTCFECSKSIFHAL